MNNVAKISAVIIVRDAEQTIGQTLESLKNFSEVILYDNGSIDRTLPIAGHYKNVKIILGEFTGFGDTKNVAANFAKNDWIFSIDSDEVLSSSLHDSIDNLELEDDCVYYCNRYNYYRKKRIKYSGWGKEKVTRLYNKKITGFNSKLVHEGIEVSRNLRHLKLHGEIRHYSYTNIADFNKKRGLYSDLFANENQGVRKSSPAIAFLSGTFAFLNTYITGLAFLDGYRGLLISVSNAHETFLKHLKLYEANLENNFKVSLIITAPANLEIFALSLKSVLTQSILPNEIIIINPSTDDALKESIKEFEKKSFIRVTTIQPEEDLNVAQLKNTAIAMSRYDYLTFVDGSSVLHRHFIKDHVSAAKRGVYLQGETLRVDKKISAKIMESKKLSLPFVYRRPFLFYKGFRIILLAKIFAMFVQKKPQKYGLNNFSIFKSELVKLNGFDEAFAQFKNCDKDFLERLYISGAKRKRMRYNAILYRLSSSGTGWLGKIRLDIEANRLPKCKNGLDKYPIPKKSVNRLI